MRWTKDEEHKAMEMFNSGLSYLDISKVFGLSRCAIAGRITRLGLRRFQPGQRVDLVGPGKIYQKRAKKVKQDQKRYIKKEAVVEIISSPPAGKEVPLLERNVNQCAYLVGHHLHCGEEVVPNTSWCAYHTQIVFNRTKDAA